MISISDVETPLLIHAGPSFYNAFLIFTGGRSRSIYGFLFGRCYVCCVMGFDSLRCLRIPKFSMLFTRRLDIGKVFVLSFPYFLVARKLAPRKKEVNSQYWFPIEMVFKCANPSPPSHALLCHYPLPPVFPVPTPFHTTSNTCIRTLREHQWPPLSESSHHLFTALFESQHLHVNFIKSH
jgi:hypothetical protein